MKLILCLISLLFCSTCFAASTATNCDTDTKIMLHMNGTDASTVFTDSSCAANSFNAVDNAQIDTAQKQFGTASGLFDGTTDKITAEDNANFDIGSGDFTFDFWVRFSSVADAGILEQGTTGASNASYSIYWLTAATTGTTNQLRWMWTTDGTAGTRTILSQVWLPVVNTWYHVAIVRSGTALKMFVDGTQLGVDQTMNQTAYNSDQVLAIGSGGGAYILNGWIDEFRYVKGLAIWTSGFSRPTVEYTVSACSSGSTASLKSSGIGVNGFLGIY